MSHIVAYGILCIMTRCEDLCYHVVLCVVLWYFIGGETG